MAGSPLYFRSSQGKDTMTRKERLLAALRREPADGTPFCTYNLHPCMNSAHAQDPSYAGLLALVEEKAGMYCKRSLGRLRRHGRESPERMTETVEDDGEHRVVTTFLHTPKGDLRSVRVTPKDQPALVTEHFLKTDDDIERYMSIPAEAQEFDTVDLDEFERQLGDRGMMTVGYSDPMYASASLFDFQDFTIRCLMQPETVRRLVEHQFERIAEDTRRRAEACAGRDFIFLTGGPEIATPPMMAPRLFQELVLPYQKKLIEIIHEHGHLAMIHCHGRVAQVLDYMIETGVDAIEPIEPPPQGDITLADLLDRAGGRMAMMGHVQDQEFHTAPPGTMTRHVEEIAKVAEGRAGYIMSPTCTPFQHPATDTFIRNYSEWIEAASRILGT